MGLNLLDDSFFFGVMQMSTTIWKENFFNFVWSWQNGICDVNRLYEEVALLFFVKWFVFSETTQRLCSYFFALEIFKYNVDLVNSFWLNV